MDHINKFNKGINSDVNPLDQPEGTYVDALNVEIINDELQGSLSISNSQGNLLQTSIPYTADIFKLSIVANIFPNTGSTITITIDGTPITSATSFIPIATSRPIDLYKFIINDINLGPLVVSKYFQLYYNELYVVFVPSIQMLTTFSVTVSDSTILYGGGTPYVPAQTVQYIIGYCIIRDDIYVFTTPCTNTDPKGNPGAGIGWGFIWKLTYDNTNFLPAFSAMEMIYAGNLDFTTYYNIPQTGVIGRWENSLTQRIYWTDNYNKLRTLNVGDKGAFALDVSLLNVVPATSFDIPLLKNMSEAPGTTSVHPAVWQLAYRYKKTGGALTAYSALSNLVNIVPRGEDHAHMQGSPDWKYYRGASSGITLTKRVVWNLINVDGKYDYIEPVLLIRNTNVAIPTVFVLPDQAITQSSVDISVDGDIISKASTITVDEFLINSTGFTHCKTIGSKDNRLVAGNLRNEISDIDFDARAFRAYDSGATSIYLTEGGIPASAISLSSAIATPVTSDSVNDYNGTHPCYYKPGTSVLGGVGANVSYEFTSVAIPCDKFTDITDFTASPYLRTDPDNSTSLSENIGVNSINQFGFDVNQTYNFGFPSKIDAGMKFTPYASLFTGYQPGEIYRIGLQLYDKQGYKYFVKWIGDIKMPEYGDPIPANNCIYSDGSLTGHSSLKKIFTNGDWANLAYTTQLGVKFNINIPTSLSSSISGYSIVRVKREDADKTVIAEGIISDSFVDTSGGHSGSSFVVNQEAALPYSGYSIAGTPYYGDLKKLNFLTPNVLNAGLAQPTAGMKLRYRSYLSKVNTVTGICPPGGCSDNYNMWKMYDETLITAVEKTIVNTQFLGGASVFPISGYIITNTDASANGLGNASYFIEVDSAISDLGINANKYLATIHNQLLKQYGGADYVSRSLNEYILCSHYRPIKTSGLNISDTFIAFGGDTINDVMDEQRLSKNWTGHPGSKLSTTFFYPACSTVNSRLRSGDSMNYSLVDDGGTWTGRDSYDYNSVYSSENDIVKCFPKPLDFKVTEDFDNRFQISEIKINGELTDSWSIFKADNYWDVEGIYGPINSMLPVKDKMYFWQDRAFGVIQINPRAVVTDNNATTNNASQLQLGTGLPLQRHDYISVTSGTKHQGSTIASYGKLYWYDSNTFKLWRFAIDEGVSPLTDVKGYYSLMRKELSDGLLQSTDKPTYTSGRDGINGVVATYDNKRNRVIYTFHNGVHGGGHTINQKQLTFAVNEITDTITGRYSFNPTIYINDGKFIFSTDNSQAGGVNLRDLYIHNIGDYNVFYGLMYDSYIKFISNPEPVITKVFDNIIYDNQATRYVASTDSYQNMNDINWTSFRITNDYQNTDKRDLILNNNIKRKERSWKLAIPRNRVVYTTNNSPNIYTDLSSTEKMFGDRIRDKYAQIELWFTNGFNTDNYQLKLNNIITQFRGSSR